MSELLLAALLLVGLALIALSGDWRARLAGAALFLLVLLRIKPKEPEPKPIKPTPIESTPDEEIHEMDDAAVSQPADTLSAEELRDWANEPDDVRD